MKNEAEKLKPKTTENLTMEIETEKLKPKTTENLTMKNETETRGIENFTNLYSLSKTLRFELIPQNETLEHIKINGLILQDENRAIDYEKVKKIIDEYHKDFIEEALSNVTLKINNENKNDSLEEHYTIYKTQSRSEKEKEDFNKIKENLRKQIANAFSSENKAYKTLFSKELIRNKLLNFVKNDEEKNLINNFKNVTSYFTGFHENRKNMYTSKEHSTGIAFRIINENLPKFIDNINSYKLIGEKIPKDIEKLNNELKKDLSVENIDEIFTLNFFVKSLSQTQIDNYNLVLGGKTLENGTKIQGLNEYINLYNQTKADRNLRLPKLKPLFKQILSDREAISWLPEVFSNDNEVLTSINNYYQNLVNNLSGKNKSDENSFLQILQGLEHFNSDKIYLKNDFGLKNISQRMFGAHDIFQKAIYAYFERYNIIGKKEKLEKYIERKDKFFKSFDSFSVNFLQECLSLIDDTEKEEKISGKKIAAYFQNLGQNEEIVSRQNGVNIEDQKRNIIELYYKDKNTVIFEEDLEEFTDVNNQMKIKIKTLNHFTRIEKAYNKIKDILGSPYPEDKKLSQDDDTIERIKLFLDVIKSLQWFVKPLLGSGIESEKDVTFYTDLLKFIYGEELSDKTKTVGLFDVNKLYDKIRNHVTKKPYSKEKTKLNFENTTLLGGWDVNKEPDNTSIILRKNGLFYLGIMNKKHNRIFKGKDQGKDQENYQKMEYKLLPGANKMLPKVFLSKKGINTFKPSEALLKNYNNKLHKSGETFDLTFCHQLIDFFKTSINKHDDWKNFNFNFSDTKNYKDISGFYREVERQGYKITFRNISEKIINDLVKDGKLYLFQIYNKDFSPCSKGTPNMHTLYWKILFDENNLKNVVYKLNGEAEIFYRPASIKNVKITHKAKEGIKNKNSLNKKTESIFEYDLVKDKRYTQDKFQFHVPITMNFKASGINNINSVANKFIQENYEKIHIIGIDRGERNLLYLSLINTNGKMIEQFSLNEIVNEYNGNEYKTNYHALLDKKEGARDEARKNWKKIENIKELKEGYLSQVIHKITDLMVKYNAIVVLEDLNIGFMRSRQKVEKQVYQKFEKMLIDKLNYLVDKKKKADELGGTLKALQLTNKFESFEKVEKQGGFLFYVPARNTSKIDPVTGFVSLFDIRYENIEKSKEFFSKFESINYNSEKKYFEFIVNDYSKFSNKVEGTKLNWTVCSNSTRIKTFKNPEKSNQWDSKNIVLTDEFFNFFNKYNISDNYKNNILEQTSTEFFKELLQLFKLTVQMRNSKIGTDVDYLISPVTDKNGIFYDSRSFENQENPPLPKDADANGAYNIARKGLILLKRLKEKNIEEFEKSKGLDENKKYQWLSNKEWLQFTQKE